VHHFSETNTVNQLLGAVLLMDHEPNTGRFVPGNKVAAGNRGNTSPKWGNKNALKHGLFESLIVPQFDKDGYLRLIQSGGLCVRISPEGYCRADDGSIGIRDDVVDELRRRGFVI
jgi:hypothetical protein